MTYKHALILFAVFITTGVGSYVLVKNDYYPVAVVNWKLVTARQLERDFNAAYRYFERALATYGSDSKRLASAEARKEIWRAALDKIIVDILIREELNRRISSSEYQLVANRKIDQFLENNQNVSEAAQTLYGLAIADFRSRLLLPQAYREILEGRMTLNGERFDEWLNKSRRQAKVIILTPDLQWQDDQVKLR